MQVTAEPELCAVAEAATRCKRGPIASMSVQVAPQPWLALDEEWAHVTLWVSPTAPAGRRNRDDDTSIGMNHHPQPARSRGATERVVERAAGKVQRGGTLGDGHGRMVPRQRRFAPARTTAAEAPWLPSTMSRAVTTWGSDPTMATSPDRLARASTFRTAVMIDRGMER